MICISADGFGGLLSQLSFCDLYHDLYPHELIEAHFICSASVQKLISEFTPCYVDYYFHKDETSDIGLCKKLSKSHGKVYCLTPDFIGTATPFGIEFSGIEWNDIKEHRFLKSKFLRPLNCNVFLALISAQDGNTYAYNQELIETLCFDHPNYTFYFSNIKHWSNKHTEIDCNLERLAATYSNFIPYISDGIVNDFNYLAQNMRYFIGVDNGCMNFAHSLGRTRILLDSRYNSLAFKARWRQTEHDLIPFDTTPSEVSRLFGLVANNSELNGLSKRFLLGLSNEHIFNAMIYKGKDKLCT